jgi:hypothetical protein
VVFLIRKVAVVFGVVLGIAIFVAAFIAYFVFRVDSTGAMLDGFGRSLSESPLLMRLIFGQERLWAGWFWFGADMVFFWGGLAIAYSLLKFGWNEKQ